MSPERSRGWRAVVWYLQELLGWLLCLFIAWLFLFAGMVWAPSAHGAGVKGKPDAAFFFQAVPLPELTRLVLTEYGGHSYVFSPEFVSETKAVTLDMRGFTREQMLAALRGMLRDAGYSLVDGGGYLLVKPWKKPEVETVTFLYRPLFRSVGYISALVSGVVPGGRFSFDGGGVRGRARDGSVEIGAAKPDGGAPDPTAASVRGLQATDSDALVFEGTRDEVDKLRALLMQVDVPVGEVFIRATVYEVVNVKSSSSAFQLVADLLGGRLGISFQPAPVAGYSATLKAAGVSAVFTALESDSRFKVVTSPAVRVVSGQAARFSVGDEVPTVGAVTYNGVAGTPTQSVVYRSSGVILSVTPTVRERRIDLVVNQQLSSFVATANGVNGSPTLQKRELESTVSLEPGSLLVLGGLDDDRGSEGRSGLSWLPSFLGSKTRDHAKSSIVVVLFVDRL